MISIIIPNYNKEQFIAETIQSVKSQTYKNWECLIIDDCSTDNSICVINENIKNDFRFKLIVNKINKGGSSSRNIGLQEANGDYIIFLDSDDLLLRTCLENRIIYISKNKNLDFAVFNMGTFYNKINDSKYMWNDFSGNHLKRFLSHSLPWHTMMLIWKKKVLLKLNGFQEDFIRLQDVELHTRALLLSNIKYNVINQKYPDCFFRISTSRISNIYTFLEKDISGKINYFKYFYKILEKNKYRKYLKGTIFASYLNIYNYYKLNKITKQESIILTNKIEKLFTLSDWFLIDRIIIKIYKSLKINKIGFKGLNFFTKLILIR